jgi:starch-binding outer membrane protein, SusD/RagB family
MAEWGNRWLDLKRTLQANTSLSEIPLKKPWSPTAQLYPIPYSELTTNPNLGQNDGY